MQPRSRTIRTSSSKQQPAKAQATMIAIPPKGLPLPDPQMKRLQGQPDERSFSDQTTRKMSKTPFWTPAPSVPADALKHMNIAVPVDATSTEKKPVFRTAQDKPDFDEIPLSRWEFRRRRPQSAIIVQTPADGLSDRLQPPSTALKCREKHRFRVLC